MSRHGSQSPAPDNEREFVAALRATLTPPSPPARWVVVALLVERPEEDGKMRPELVVYEPRAGWRARQLPLDIGTSTCDPGVFLSASCGDLEGNGEPSLVCGLTRESGRCSLLRFHMETGDWKPELLAELGEDTRFLRSVALGDLDADGQDEIVIGTRPNGQVLLLDPGPDGLKPTVIDEASYGWETTNTREIVIADVDGDGRLEILAAIARTDTEKWGPTPGSVCLYSLHNGSWKKRVVDDFDGQSHSRMIAVGRLGEDDHEVIVANRVGVHRSDLDLIDPGSELYVYRVNGAAVEKEPLATLEGAIKSRGFAIGDVDGDGENELIAGTRTLDIPGHGETSLLCFKWDRARRRWSRETLAKSGPLGFHCVAVADVDGDGKAEIIASDDGTGSIHLYYQSAQGWRRRPLVETACRLFVVSIDVVFG